MRKLLLVLAAFLMVGDAIAQCTASFTSTFAPGGNDLLRYDFTNTSTSTASSTNRKVSATISYGDGSWDQFQAPWNTSAHNYAAPGTYTVRVFLSVYDSVTMGVVCADTVMSSLTVAYAPCPYSISQTAVNDSTVTFTATNPAGTPGITYTWSFGDGTSASGASVTHTYKKGFYNVTVVSSGASCSYTNGTSLYLTWNDAFHCDSVHKSFSVGNIGRLATVSSSAYLNSGYPGYVIRESYNFGDGSAATTSQQHQYTATGAYAARAFYEVEDTVSSTIVCRDTLVDSVYITQLNSDLLGRIWYDSTTYPTVHSNIKAWLIKHDAATGTLTAVDSLLLTNSGGYVPFRFQNVPADTYLVKVAWPMSGTGTGIVPTYGASSLLWSGAQRYAHDGLYDFYYANVTMQTGTLTSGPGFVGGSVALGANKGTASGAPGVSMILRDAAENLVAMTETDAQGNYSFRNVPVGTYTVLPELINFDAAASVPFSITASGTTVNGISFFKDDTKMSIRAANVGVEKTAVSMLSVSPNPARNSVRIVADNKAALELELRDLSGKVVHRGTLAAGAILNLDVRLFPAGLYFLHAGSGAPIKLVIE